MTETHHFPEFDDSRSRRRPHTETGGDSPHTSPERGFCDLHIFHRYGAPSRIVVVNGDPSWRQLPVVTWLEVRSNEDAASTAALIQEILALRADESGVPVRLFDHDPHGNIHSWPVRHPTQLTRERVTPHLSTPGRAEP